MLFAHELLTTKHLFYWRPTQKRLQLEECIMPHFKIDLNIFVICNTAKIKIPTRENPNTHKLKWDNENTHKVGNEKAHKGL